MKEFIRLQKRLFPVYFGTQVGLTALTAATHPPYSILSLIRDPWSAAPLAIVGLTGCLNWNIYGPQTTTATLVRMAIQGGFLRLPGYASSCNYTARLTFHSTYRKREYRF